MTRKEKIAALIGIGFPPEQVEALIRVFNGDAPSPPNGEANVQVLYYLIGADLASTEDQPFTKAGNFSGGIVSQIFATNGSTTPTSAAGGIYGGASKAAPTFVASTQSWAGLTTNKRVVIPQLSAQQFQVNGDMFLSLTTASTVPATADFYVFGVSTHEVF